MSDANDIPVDHLREVNALEQRIVASEADSDDLLWEQARQVTLQIATGLKQRQLARHWINARTGDPYSAMHVHRTARAYACNLNVTPRPRFRDAYNAIANAQANRSKAGPAAVTDTNDTTPKKIDKSRAGVAARRATMRDLAKEGYTSRQMAERLGISEEGCRTILRNSKITVPADQVTRFSRRLDPNRIVEHMVFAAVDLCADVNLIVFAGLDRSRLPAWVRSLRTARRELQQFIQLLQELSHVEAGRGTPTPDIQGAAGPGQGDADGTASPHTAEV